MLKKLSAFKDRKRLREGIWKRYRHSADLFSQRIENVKYKRISPYYRNVYSQECFRQNIQQIDERSHELIIMRCCQAYQSAVAHYKEVSLSAYQVSAEWNEIIRKFYAPLVKGLLESDVNLLKPLLGNFCRSSISRGLELGIEFERLKAKGFDLRLANDYLRRLHIWRAFVSAGKGFQELAFPYIGNPFGVVIDGVLVPFCAPRHHYYSRRLETLCQDTSQPVVLEIGGGFGGMAYYLLQDSARGYTYLNFDLPEVLALCSYFLLCAFPKKRVLLFGEAELTSSALKEFDIVLRPHFDLPAMEDKSVDVIFNSNSMVEMREDTVGEYLRQIERIARFYFLHNNYLHGDLDRDLAYTGNISKKLRMLTAPLLPQGSFRREYILESLFDPSYYECLYRRVA